MAVSWLAQTSGGIWPGGLCLIGTGKHAFWASREATAPHWHPKSVSTHWDPPTFRNVCFWWMLLSKVTSIVLKVYNWSVHAFLGIWTDDPGVSSTMLYCLSYRKTIQVQKMCWSTNFFRSYCMTALWPCQKCLKCHFHQNIMLNTILTLRWGG